MFKLVFTRTTYVVCFQLAEEISRQEGEREEMERIRMELHLEEQEEKERQKEKVGHSYRGKQREIII